MFRAADAIERTDTGRQRRGNEDSSYVHAPLFVVADGMGGAQAGEVASRVAVEQFKQGLSQEGSTEERLATVVQRANREIYELSHASPDRAGMGTTVTAAYLDEDHVAIAHVGDSRAYLMRDRELTRLTEDHSLVEELRRKGKLTEQEALEHPQRSIITRALGPEPEVDVDTLSYPVRAGDVVMLCSDGLTSMIPERIVEQILAAAPSLAAAADQLVAEANDAGGKDNITVILFRVEDVDPQAAAGVEQPTMISIPGPDGSVATVAPPATEPSTPASPPPSSPPSGARRRGAARGRAASGERHAVRQERHAVRQERHAVRQARLARTQGFTRRHEGPRHFGLLGKTVATLTALAVVLFLVGGGGYLASRQLYFLATNSQGTVVVYRGFPYVLPFGVPLYETFYVSGVPAATIPVDRRTTLLGHNLHSQSAAINLINSLELGKISG